VRLARDQRIEQQVDGTRRASPHRRHRRLGRFQHPVGLHEAAAAHRCPQRRQMRLAGRFRIERFQAFGRSAQQQRCVASAGPHEGDVGPQAIDSRAIQLMEGAHRRHRQETLSR
jgi:hypothetical protein